MRITVVTSIFPPEIGGPATYAWEILHRLNAEGHQVKVVTPCEGAKATDNVIIASKKRLRIRIIGYIHYHLALLIAILRAAKGCDLIYTLNPAYIGLISLVAAKLLRKPIVLRFVGDKAWESAHNKGTTTKPLEDFLKLPEGGGDTKKWLRLQRFMFSQVNRIIVPSCFLRDILVDYYNVNPAKIRIIYNSVDLSLYEGEPMKRPQKAAKCIVTVGRIIRHKKIDGIIRAVKALAGGFPDISLLIIGEGPEKGNLEKLAQEMRLESRVQLYGRAAHEETIKLVKEADIFVLNSIYEGMPHAVIEAMACRTPVIATDIGGTDEVVKDGETGLLVAANNDEELREKLSLLLKDKELRKRLLGNAYKDVEQKFTWEKNLSILEKELEEVLQ